ncbi:MAG TPA: plastocyanin/azurin family copper-binding protein [Thermoleophilaceae bacterium]|nr:plastocyanin/azurin family copper-binding protein [Thermoleophilaceae bacterium]
MKSLAALCSALAIAAAVAGCGGGGGKSSSGGGKQSTKSSSGGAQASGKAVTVDMKNIQFTPRSLTVKSGTIIKWVNRDSVNHDVTKQGGPGPKFSSGTGNLGQGATYAQTVTGHGVIRYVCTVHAPGMAGTITVK